MLSNPNKKRVLLAALLLAGTSVAIAISSPRLRLRPASHPQLPRLRNNTNSVQIGDLRQLGNGDVEITLINKSSRAIYGYTILTIANQIQKGLTTYATVEPINPSGAKAERIPAGYLEFTPGIDSPELIFSAAYFEGGTSEGDTAEAGKLSRTMRGMKANAQLALDILNDAIQSSESDDDRLITTIESKISSIDANQNTSDHASQLGREMITDRLNRELKKVRAARTQPAVSVRARLKELTIYYERLAKKL